MRSEAAAVEHAMSRVIAGEAVWIASTILALEVAQNKSLDKREFTSSLLRYAKEHLEPDSNAIARARELAGLGYGAADAFHIAVGEQASADFLITTDDRLLRRALRGVGRPRLRILNPVEWVSEVKDGDSGNS